MNDLKYIEEKLKDSFDVKNRRIDTVLGKATLIFIDDLSGANAISEYVILPLRGHGYIERARGDVKTPNDVVEKLIDLNASGIAKDKDDAITACIIWRSYSCF